MRSAGASDLQLIVCWMEPRTVSPQRDVGWCGELCAEVCSWYRASEA